jgi:hypothetical protein
MDTNREGTQTVRNRDTKRQRQGHIEHKWTGKQKQRGTGAQMDRDPDIQGLGHRQTGIETGKQMDRGERDTNGQGQWRTETGTGTETDMDRTDRDTVGQGQGHRLTRTGTQTVNDKDTDRQGQGYRRT